MTEEKDYSLKKSSSGLLGQLDPVKKDAHGNIIDGFHRLKEDPKWRTETLDHIDNVVKLELARLAVNFCRRKVEKEELDARIGFLIGAGLKPQEIADETGISVSTVYRHMPVALKDKVKSEAIKEGLQKVEQVARATFTNVKTPETKPPIPKLSSTPVECSGLNCSLGTNWPTYLKDGRALCPRCLEQAWNKGEITQNDILPEGEAPKVQVPTEKKPKGEVKEYKPKETWEHRKATMQVQHSKAENKIVQKLRKANLGPVITERFFCAEGSVPDAYLPKYNAIIYVDGPPHEGREDRDDLLRQKVADRNRVRVLPVKVKNDSDKETERGFKEIVEALS